MKFGNRGLALPSLRKGWYDMLGNRFRFSFFLQRLQDDDLRAKLIYSRRKSDVMKTLCCLIPEKEPSNYDIDTKPRCRPP